MPPLLKVEDLHLSLGGNKVLNGVSFEVHSGDVVGIVGESGCGKSTTASALLRLLPPKHHLTGKVEFDGVDLLSLSAGEMAARRGIDLSLILQDPALALNPLIPIGRQLIEGLCYHQRLSYRDGIPLGIQWLGRVGISDPEIRMKQYPHEISGGMKQRILIAMALICKPTLLIADEPTTALDVTMQLQILDLLKSLQEEEKMSLLLITHDLGVVAHICHQVLVMQRGVLVESGPVKEVFQSPQHPYTKSLLEARRRLVEPRSSGLRSGE